MAAYISGIGAFLPNDPIGNDELEHLLGQVDGARSRSRALVLRSNGIKTRHYALDRASGEMTHTNCELTVEAINALCVRTGFSLEDLECLSCGTSSPDQMMPNHSVMVHAELGSPPCETVSTSGVCCSGLTALKYGYLSVLSGTTTNAVTTASELPSAALLAENYESRSASDDRDVERLSANPSVAFEADFLRWMLSDAASAVLITDKPLGETVSLRIDWVEIISMAHLADPCTYFGAEKFKDGTLLGWLQLRNPRAALEGGHFQLRQDVRQLADMIAPLFGETLEIVRKRRGIQAEEYDWFLPHYSSEYFRKPTRDVMSERGFEIPDDKWFTNLPYKGNTGSASIFVMLEELLNGGRLQPGQKLFCLVPESSRFTYGYMQLTVV
ncbi:beta-ketoacyl-ACP synthase III [Kribbella sancticallisti]|uniref:Beta-ketoacyl-ACP synthase III n=1 Tax=Kribbella sancticallisti TaxID=460087 RepID=A0ABP4QKF7_9ACTN